MTAKGHGCSAGSDGTSQQPGLASTLLFPACFHLLKSQDQHDWSTSSTRSRHSAGKHIYRSRLLFPLCVCPVCWLNQTRRSATCREVSERLLWTFLSCCKKFSLCWAFLTTESLLGGWRCWRFWEMVVPRNLKTTVAHGSQGWGAPPQVR